MLTEGCLRELLEDRWRKADRHVNLRTKAEKKAEEFERAMRLVRAEYRQKGGAGKRCSARERSRGRCWWRGIEVAKHDGSIDHVIPLSRGGKNANMNLVWSCKPCNYSKGSKLPGELCIPGDLDRAIRYAGQNSLSAFEASLYASGLLGKPIGEGLILECCYRLGLIVVDGIIPRCDSASLH